jgi:two-component system CheB/CheR fusion protein
LSRLTGRNVTVAADGAALQPDHILVMPPGFRAGFRAGRLRLRRAPELKADDRADPVDRLFRSVSEAFGPLAVGIVLSGTGTDGMLGLQAVGGAGGLAMAQDAASAAHAEMPDAAAASGFADHVGPPEALAAALIEHDRHRAARLGGAGDAARRRAAAVARLPEVCAVLRERTGHDFRHYKATTLVRRLERRMRVLRLDSIDGYLERLQAEAQEPTTLFRELLVGVTAFFRDPEAFQVLAERAIAPLLAGRAPTDPLRIWVAGCATGEEAYSVAMVVREAMDAVPSPCPCRSSRPT